MPDFLSLTTRRETLGVMAVLNVGLKYLESSTLDQYSGTFSKCQITSIGFLILISFFIHCEQ